MRYLREEQWQPALWSRQTLRPWMESGAGLDADRARQIALDLQRKASLHVGMPPELENEVLRVIEKARKHLEFTQVSLLGACVIASRLTLSGALPSVGYLDLRPGELGR